MTCDFYAGCPDGWFLCRDESRCIPPEFVCDISPDCRDASDEKTNCRKWTILSASPNLCRLTLNYITICNIFFLWSVVYTLDHGIIKDDAFNNRTSAYPLKFIISLYASIYTDHLLYLIQRVHRTSSTSQLFATYWHNLWLGWTPVSLTLCWATGGPAPLKITVSPVSPFAMVSSTAETEVMKTLIIAVRHAFYA